MKPVLFFIATSN